MCPNRGRLSPTIGHTCPWCPPYLAVSPLRKSVNWHVVRKRTCSLYLLDCVRVVKRGHMNSFLQDVRYAGRQLLKTPGFTVVAILTLALGIGANIAAFSIVDGVLLRPLPFPHPAQLVRVFDDLRNSNTKDVGMSVPQFWDYRIAPASFKTSPSSGPFPLTSQT